MGEKDPVRNAMHAKELASIITVDDDFKFEVRDNQKGKYRIYTGKNGFKFENIPQFEEIEPEDIWATNQGSIVMKYTHYTGCEK